MNLRNADLSDVVEVIVGPALETLPSLASRRRGTFDMTFIDADKASYPNYFDWALRLSRPGSLIVIDNVVRHGEVIDSDHTDANIIGVRRMIDMIASEPRVIATAIQTVGVRGYDGFAAAFVRS